MYPIEKDEISAQMFCVLSEGWEGVLSLPLCDPVNPVREMVPENLPKEKNRRKPSQGDRQ